MINTLVFVHGWASGPQIWRAQEGYFSKKYEVILPDISGAEDIKEAAGLIGAAIKDRKDFVLIGWSLGWLAVLELLNDFTLNPNGLIAVNSTAGFCDDSYPVIGPSQTHPLKMIRYFKRNPPKALESFYEVMLSEAGKSMLSGMKLKSQAYDKFIYGLYMLRDCDYRAFITTIEIPALIICGSKDKICPSEASEYMYKKIIGSRLEKLDCGHMPFLDKKDEFNSLVEDFVKGL